MIRRARGVLGLALLIGHAAHAQTILGTTGDYAVMAGSTVTINSPTTIINGNLGAANIAGSGSYTLNGTTFPPLTPVSPAIAQNFTDLTRAYSGLAAMTPDATYPAAQILGAGGVTTLTPGVYRFTSTAQLNGTLTLDAQGQSNAVWVFQIGSTLTTAAGSAVTFVNLAPGNVASDGLFWQIGTTATFGTNTTFQGNVLGSSTSIFDFGSGATISQGRALTGSAGTITLAGNTIDFVGASSGFSGGLGFVDSGNSIGAVPEPASSALIAAVAALGLAWWRRRRAA